MEVVGFFPDLFFWKFLSKRRTRGPNSSSAGSVEMALKSTNRCWGELGRRAQFRPGRGSRISKSPREQRSATAAPSQCFRAKPVQEASRPTSHPCSTGYDSGGGLPAPALRGHIGWGPLASSRAWMARRVGCFLRGLCVDTLAGAPVVSFFVGGQDALSLSFTFPRGGALAFFATTRGPPLDARGGGRCHNLEKQLPHRQNYEKIQWKTPSADL